MCDKYDGSALSNRCFLHKFLQSLLDRCWTVFGADSIYCCQSRKLGLINVTHSMYCALGKRRVQQIWQPLAIAWILGASPSFKALFRDEKYPGMRQTRLGVLEIKHPEKDINLPSPGSTYSLMLRPHSGETIERYCWCHLTVHCLAHKEAGRLIVESATYRKSVNQD